MDRQHLHDRQRQWQGNDARWQGTQVKVPWSVQDPCNISNRSAGLTFVPDHPSLKAASCASSSPNPNINPLTNGSNRLIAAPRIKPHIVSGEYSIIGDLEEDGGEGDKSFCEDS